MRSASRAWVVAVALVLSRAAGAQSDMTEEERLQEAVRLSQLGQLHYDGGEFDQAAEAFSRAWELHPDTILGYNAARSYENAGDPQQALHYYEATLELLGPGGDPELAQRCRDGRTRIQNLLARVEAERASQPATLQVRTQPPGATIRVDGVDQGATPADLTLAAGAYTVAVELEGFLLQEELVELEPAQRLLMSVTLVERPSDIGSAEDDHEPNWLAVGLVGGGGVLFITLGALAGAEAHDKYDEASSPEVMRDDPAFDAAVERGTELRNGSNFFYGLGILAVGTAVVLYFVTDDSADQTETADPQVYLEGGPGGAAAGIRLGF